MAFAIFPFFKLRVFQVYEIVPSPPQGTELPWLKCFEQFENTVGVFDESTFVVFGIHVFPKFVRVATGRNDIRSALPGQAAKCMGWYSVRG